MGFVKATLEHFLIKARQKHGLKYDYSKTEYLGNTSPVIVICPEHGEFSQMPSVHYRGGCPKCGRVIVEASRRSDQKSFLEAAKKIHGDTYDYSEVVYVRSNKKVKIVCQKHGLFLQTPSKHLFGSGCKKCGDALRGENRSSSTDEFLEKAFKVHGSRYSYSKTVYVSATKKIEIDCSVHGTFLQTPNNHLDGRGCKSCAHEAIGGSKRLGLEEFLSRAYDKHSDKYDYSLVEYKSGIARVKIICPIHGLFEQKPVDHMLGKGCRACIQTGYKPQRSGIIYVLKCGNITKVGITNSEVKRRCREVNNSSGLGFQPVTFMRFEDGSVPDDVETEVLKYLRGKYQPVDSKFDGSTECFIDVDYAGLLLQIAQTTYQIMSGKTNI